MPWDVNDVDAFIKKTRKEPQLEIPKDFSITLHGPSGTAIHPTESISVLIPGNSAENPLRVQISHAFKPASDPKLTKFWNSLREISKVDGFLYFHIRAEFFPNRMKSFLYVRKAYEDMFDIIYKNHIHEDPVKQFHGMAITGTPGIGKSVFLFYTIWRLANMKVKGAVILHRQLDAGEIYVFQNEGCWMTMNRKHIRLLLKDPDTWYLTDALLPPPGQLSAVTILVSPPFKEYYSTFLSMSHVAPLHYLPVWSLEELKLVAKAYLKEPVYVEERFDKIGGVPRYVLEKDMDLDDHIDDAIKLLTLNKLMSIASGEVLKDEEISHRIVHFDVRPPFYHRRTLMMASNHVLEEALRKFLCSSENDMKQFILWSDGVPSLAPLRGTVFENYVHEKLSKEGEFLVRPLDDGTKSTLKVPQRKFQRFWNVSECKDLNVYYRVAKKNQTCIDSLIVNEGYFQVTTNLEHPIEKQKMRDMVDVLGMKKLYFVVPHTIFEKFEKQNFKEDVDQANCAVRSSGEQDLLDKRPLKEVNNSDENKRQKMTETKSNKIDGRNFIQQYVICIPVDARIDLSALERRRNKLLALSGREQFQTMAS